MQAMFTRDLLTATFSHPNVESFTMWGFWDGAHWQSNAPLYRADWTLKPAGEQWQRLIYNTWWTDVRGVTDAEGTYKTRGFYGDYEIAVTYEGTEQTYRTSLIKGADNKVTVIWGQEPTEERPSFVPLPIPDQTADITAPVWPYGSVFGAADVAPASVTLNWPKAHDNIEVDHYLLYKDGSLLEQIPAHLTSYDVTGLAQNQTYVFTIKAVDQQGNHSVESEAIRVTTPSGTDDVQPGWYKGSYLTVSDLHQSGAVISWPKGVDKVRAASYRVYVNGRSIVDTAEQSYSLTDLLENTQYTVRVETKDEHGNISSGGPIVVFKTLGTVDTAAPTWNEPGFTASGVTSNSLTLHWTPAQDNREVTAYRVFKGNQELITLPASAASYEVRGLSDYTTYEFKIKAGDGDNNWSDVSPQLTITTAVANDDVMPTWPKTRLLTYSSLTDREVTLQWTQAEDNIGVTGYRIYQNNSLIASVDGNVYNYSVSNLEADQSYSFRVEAVDAFGNSSNTGPSISVRTHSGLVRQAYRLHPSDDAFPQAPAVFGGAGTTNNLAYLRYKNAAGASGSEQNKNTGNNRRVYMKFPLNTVTGSVYEASLSFYVSAVQTPNIDINMALYATGNNWSESTINWLNKPEAGTRLDSSTVRNAGYWKTIPVTDYVMTKINGDTAISFMLQDDNWLDQNVDIYSKEASDAALRPYLLISTAAVEEDAAAPIWSDGTLNASHVKPDRVTLTWSGASDETGITSYNIYQDNVLFATVGADVSSLEVIGLNPSASYEFRIVAKDTKHESAGGPTVRLTTPDADRQAPVWPADSALEADSVSRFSAALSWTAAEDEYGIDHYLIYQGAQVIAHVPGSKTAYTVTGLPAGTTTELTISAKDAAGNETAGLTVTVSTLAADTTAPAWEAGNEFIASHAGTTGMLLHWPEASDDTAVARYEVYAGDAKAADLEGAVTSYYINGLEDDTAYTFSVAALDEAGNRSSRLELARSTLKLDTITPVWPTGSRITTTQEGDDVILRWDSAIDNVSINNYNIYRNSSFMASVDGKLTSYTIAGASDLNAVYKVEAVDFMGNMTIHGPGTDDPEIPFPSDTTPPTWPAGSKLRANNITQTSVQLVWTPAADQMGITAYRLLQDGRVLANPTGTTWLVDNLEAGRKYKFKVEAADAAGNWTKNGPALTVRTLRPAPGKRQPDARPNPKAPRSR
ncbi:fibronectin type III domain-containing protein [Paenibacillus abyssi]